MPAEDFTPFEVFPNIDLMPGQPIVARLTGRRFDQVFDGRFEQPFDPRFGKAMVKTLAHLCLALGASYGYAERADLSLYAVSQGGEARRLASRICGEAAAKLSLLLGTVATFEVRLYQFPSLEEACRYFEWRMHEAGSTALDHHCQHVLTLSGADPTSIGKLLENASFDEKLDLLRQNSVDFTQTAAWQRRGAGVYVTQEGASGARLVVDLNLPADPEYPSFLRQLLA